MPRVSIEGRMSVEADLDDVLGDISSIDIVEHFTDNNDIGSLIDAIGKDAFLSHFGIEEKEAE